MIKQRIENAQATADAIDARTQESFRSFAAFVRQTHADRLQLEGDLDVALQHVAKLEGRLETITAICNALPEAMEDGAKLAEFAAAALAWLKGERDG